MAVTKVFRSGNSQAVRIPKEFHIEASEVEITRRGDEIVLVPRRRNLGDVVDLLASLSDDFFEDGRQQPETDKRTGF